MKHVKETIKDIEKNAQVAMKAGAVVLPLMLGLAPGAGAKEQRHQPLERAARMLKGRVIHFSPVEAEANYDIYWSRREADGRHYFKTSTPLTTEVRGRTRYFHVLQTGKSLASLAIRPIKGPVTRVQSAPTYVPTPDMPFGTDPFEPIYQKVHLDARHRPVLEAAQLSGDVHELVAGYTTPRSGGAIVARQQSE